MNLILSAIIPAYNALPAVLRCISTLGKVSTSDIQLLVQDDCSPAVNFVEALELLPFASTERNPVNLGFAGNCNAGAKRAQGEILCFINQDIAAHPTLSQGWDTALLRAFDDPSVGIVGARLLFPDGKVQSVGGCIDPRGTPFHRCLGWENLNHEEISTAQDVAWVTGAVMAIRRTLFEQVGGFDTLYRAYFEDVDLCLKIRALGYRVRYEPGCTLVHSVGSTGGSPHFMDSALKYRARWVETGRVKPDVQYLAPVRFW